MVTPPNEDPVSRPMAMTRAAPCRMVFLMLDPSLDGGSDGERGLSTQLTASPHLTRLSFPVRSLPRVQDERHRDDGVGDEHTEVLADLGISRERLAGERGDDEE